VKKEKSEKEKEKVTLVYDATQSVRGDVRGEEFRNSNPSNIAKVVRKGKTQTLKKLKFVCLLKVRLIFLCAVHGISFHEKVPFQCNSCGGIC
jgi:hypothetical protein